ncbi:MAG: GNAT family N-acetyltransferase [Tabrizicola sp.]
MTRPWEIAPARGPLSARSDRFAALVPVIETERLRLRAPRIGDFPIFARFLCDADLHDATEDDRKAAWLDFCQLLASWPLRGIGPWTIEDRDGRAVGGVAVNHEYGDPEIELGWVVTDGAGGRGIATEAARAARAWLFATQGFSSLVSYIDPDNAASVAVAERLGATRDAVAEAAIGHDCLVYRHLPEITR